MSSSIKSLVEAATATFVDKSITSAPPINFIRNQLSKSDQLSTEERMKMVSVMTAYANGQHCPAEAFEFFSIHCHQSPSMFLVELFTELARKTLKTNSDFSKHQKARHFMQDYFVALYKLSGNRAEALSNFVHSLHGMTSVCPFPRVLPNLLAVCLTGVYAFYEAKHLTITTAKSHLSTKKSFSRVSFLAHFRHDHDHDHADHSQAHSSARRANFFLVSVFVTVLNEMSKYEDWRAHYAAVMSSVPFHHAALTDAAFLAAIAPSIRAFAKDTHCAVHCALLNNKEGKDGWIHLYAPGAPGYVDDGVMFDESLSVLFGCCQRRKRFCLSLLRYLSALMLLALRESKTGITVLIAMLEYDVVDNAEMRAHIVTALNATADGRSEFEKLEQSRRSQETTAGYKKLSMPINSTDSDLQRILSTSQCAHLELLSLAFTNVTSACANVLCNLKCLRYLNLWRTSFGDDGLEKVCDRLQKLQVLNLAETKVTDVGARYLIELKHLRKLNLSNTSVSSSTIAFIREKLPTLEEIDLRYTEVW